MEIDRVRAVPGRFAPADVAFGAVPGADIAPGNDVLGRWQRAVALAGQGFYARARAEVEQVRGDIFVQSLTLSARASWLRQLGWHHVAAGLDGPALRLAFAVRDEPRKVEAMCDAMTGLAADGIGQGRLGVSTALLTRVDETLAPLPEGRFWRQRVRLDWVTAETALARGDAAAALPRAKSAFDRARASGSLRHEIKSQLLVAAATAGTGDLDECAALASTVVARCADNGLVPLEWAASMLLAGVRPDSAGRASAERCAKTIESRGGVFR